MEAHMLTEAIGDFAYQLVGEQYLQETDEAILQWGYSTGKTRVAATRLVWDPRIKNTLYFTRKNNVSGTARELRKHCTLDIVELTGSTQRVHKVVEQFSSSLRTQSVGRVFLTNYDKARTALGSLESLQCEAVIVDESTAIKRKSQRTRAICALAHSPWVIFRCVMAGEMAPQRKQDYFWQFFCADRGYALGKSEWGFMGRYFNRIGYETVMRPGARERLLKVVADHSHILRTSDVRIPLRVQEKMLRVPLTKEQKHWLTMLSEQCCILPDGTAWMVKNPAVAFEKALQVCSGYVKLPEYPEGDGSIHWLKGNNPKLEALVTLIAEEMTDHLASDGPKITIWARRNQELDSIAHRLKEVGVNAVQLRGKQTARQNEHAMLNMLNNPEVRVCIAQADMGVGVNELITCDTSIWYSNSHSVESRMQAEMRFDRPGQKYRVLNHIDVVMDNGEDHAVALSVGQARMDCVGFTNKAQLMQAVRRKLALTDKS